MARTDVTRTDVTKPYGGAPGQINWTAGDTSNGMNVDISPNGKALLLVRNTSGSTDYDFDLISTSSSKTNRTGDITSHTVTAGEVDQKKLDYDGWDQGSNNVHIDNVENSALEFALLVWPD